MNDQRSLKDQLDDLAKLAVDHKLYDAHDWILKMQKSNRPERHVPVPVSKERE